MKDRPLIQLTIDAMDESHPTPCSPCVWVALIDGRDGCATDVNYYSPTEILARLQEFRAEIAQTIASDRHDAFSSQRLEIYEATACSVHDISATDAIDAISIALARYFETGDTPADSSFYHFTRPVALQLTTAWNNRTDRMTLLPDSTLVYHTPE